VRRHTGEDGIKAYRGKEDGELLKGNQSKIPRWHIQNRWRKYFSTQALVKLLNCLIVEFETQNQVRFKKTMTIQKDNENICSHLRHEMLAWGKHQSLARASAPA